MWSGTPVVLPPERETSRGVVERSALEREANEFLAASESFAGAVLGDSEHATYAVVRLSPILSAVKSRQGQLPTASPVIPDPACNAVEES